jgi:hypothetical protein
MLAGLALVSTARFNQLAGVRFAAGCWVHGMPSQSSGLP